MRDVVARLGFDQAAEFFALIDGAVRTDQHAVAARFTDCFDHHLVQIFEDVITLRLLSQDESFHIRQNRIFAEVVANDCGHVGVSCLIVGDSRSYSVHQRHISGAICVEQSGNTEARVGAEAQRIDEVVIDAAIDHIHAAQSRRGSHVHDIVVHQQVASFDQFDSHLLGKECVLEICGVEDARRQQNDGGFISSGIIWRNERSKCGQQRLRIMFDRTHAVIAEQPRKDPLQHFAVRQHV